jgi:hypothetical protein
MKRQTTPGNNIETPRQQEKIPGAFFVMHVQQKIND